MSRLILAINCFGAGVFFALIGCRLDAGIATRNPAWMDVAGLLFLSAIAVISVTRAAS